MLINTTLNKTHNIHDSESTYDFAVNNVMVIIITISKTLGIYDLLKNYFMLLRKYECFQCFNIYTSTSR